MKDGCSYSMQGPLYFNNHDCESNCSYEVQKCKKGVVLLRTVGNIEKGSEITVKYGKSFLRQYRVQPVSLQQVSYIKAGRQGNVKTLNKNAVWQKLLSLLCGTTNRTL